MNFATGSKPLKLRHRRHHSVIFHDSLLTWLNIVRQVTSYKGMSIHLNKIKEGFLSGEFQIMQ